MKIKQIKIITPYGGVEYINASEKGELFIDVRISEDTIAILRVKDGSLPPAAIVPISFCIIVTLVSVG